MRDWESFVRFVALPALGGAVLGLGVVGLVCLVVRVIRGELW